MAALGSSYFVFKARDNVSPVAKGIRTSLGSIRASAGFVGQAFKAAAAAATVAFGAISAGAALAVKSAIAEEREVSLLNSLLKTRGLLTAENTKLVEEALEAGKKLSFSGGEIREGIGTATQFTNNFNKALKILAAAQNLARAKNISLEQATKLVGKAFAGNGNALKNYGVNLKETVTTVTEKVKADKEGYLTTEKQVGQTTRIIKGLKALDAVNESFSGSAKAYADTTAGMLERFGDTFDDLRKKIGTALLPALQDVLRGVGPILDQLVRDVSDKLPDLEKFAGELASDIPRLVANIYIKARKELPAIIDKVSGFIRGIADFARDAAAFLGPDGLIETGIGLIGYKIGGLRGAITAVLTKAFSDVGLGEFESLLAASITTAVISGLGSALVQAAVLAFAAKLRGGARAAAVSAIPPVVPAGAPPAAAATGGAGAAGAGAVAGVVAVAGAAAAVASIVGIAAIAYSSIVPKETQAAISKRLGEFGRRAGEQGTATGAGGAYNAGGMYQGGTSSYLQNFTSNTTLKLDGKVIAQSVNRYLTPAFSPSTGTRTGGR